MQSPRVQQGIKCTYRRCTQVFDTEKEMKSHKHHDPKHHYCRKCDYDAKDWDDMLNHKVESMAPFIIGEKRHDKYKKMKHLCCEYCGEDFKSMEGRANHRREMHQASQYVECQGCGPVWNEENEQIDFEYCGQVFLRPSLLIAHYEKGHCRFVTPSEWNSERQHKHVIKQILEDPDAFSGIIAVSKAMLAMNEVNDEDASSIAERSASGSYDLMDDDVSTADMGTITSLVPHMEQHNLLDQEIDNPVDPADVIRNKLFEWNNMSSDQTTPASAFSSASGSVRVGRAASRADIGTPGNRSQPASAVRGSSPAPSQATINSYISQLESTSSSVDWNALALTRKINASDGRASQGSATSQSSNFFTARWYDPHAQGYNPDLFWHPLLEIYKCPFASCGGEFADQGAMEEHLRYVHVIKRIQCPTCDKFFSTVAGLVRHFEASARGSRCWVANLDDFGKVLNEVSGGFLDVRDVNRRAKKGGNEIEGYMRAGDGQVVKVEGQVGKGKGVMELEFRGAKPYKWEERKVQEFGLENLEEERKQRKNVAWGKHGKQRIVW